MYKYETHVHTTACSLCASSTGREYVDTAKALGYSGFVITNHFWGGNTRIDRSVGWEQFVKVYKDDYEDTRAYGESQGIDVFFGIEDGIGKGKEILIFGIDPDELMRHSEYLEMSLEEKTKLLHSLGGVVFMAHPFRNRPGIAEPDVQPNPALFDGLEGHNQYTDKAENDKAFAFAKENGLVAISGGDVHKTVGFGNAGVEFDEKPKDYADFLSKILKNEFTLIIK